jgi:uncharacterized protein (TIGR02453 family)
MSTPVTTAFSGFHPEAIQFLADLAANNDRAWFQPRKAEYERLLKEPLAALVTALTERFAARNVPLLADPARSPFRIYRDVRFSKDRSPYKTNVGASFPWIEGRAAPSGGPGAQGAGRHDVGGYFHLAPGDIFVGGGMWHPGPAALIAFRQAIVSDRARVHAALDEPGFRAHHGHINGDRLKRVPAGYAGDDPDAELLKLKDVVFGKRLADADAASPELPDLVTDALAAATPVLRFLASLGT